MAVPEPTVADVAAWVPQRTNSEFGYQGTFTAATRPSESQVRSLIASAAGTVGARVGTDPPAAQVEAVRALVALRTAMLVELTFYASEIRADRSPYAELKALYDDELAVLVAVMVDVGGDDGAVGLPDAAFQYPEPRTTWCTAF